MSDVSTCDPDEKQHSGGIRLGLSIGLIALAWLVVLPWIAKRPEMEEHLNRLDARGIDASAMYYTDLEMMDRILERLERRR